jgi:hypothetical protein
MVNPVVHLTRINLETLPNDKTELNSLIFLGLGSMRKEMCIHKSLQEDIFAIVSVFGLFIE